MTDSDAAIIAGLNALADALGIMDQKLDVLVEAITAEPPPSNLEPLLHDIMHLLVEIRDQTKPKPNGQDGAAYARP